MLDKEVSRTESSKEIDFCIHEVLEVDWHHVFNGMVRFFRRDDILAKNKVKMVNGAGKVEKSEDIGGVFLTLFWN